MVLLVPTTNKQTNKKGNEERDEKSATRAEKQDHVMPKLFLHGMRNEINDRQHN